jgi:hypothetical protein
MELGPKKVDNGIGTEDPGKRTLLRILRYTTLLRGSGNELYY